MREVLLSRASAADILQGKKNNQQKKFSVSRENVALFRKNKRCTVSLLEGMFANDV